MAERSEILWNCPQARSWQAWLAEQPLYDQLSSLDGLRAPPCDLAGFVAQERSCAPDLNDGVRVISLPCNVRDSWLPTCSPPRTSTRQSRIESIGGPMNVAGAGKASSRSRDGGEHRYRSDRVRGVTMNGELRYVPNPKRKEPWQRRRRGSLCPR